LTQYNYPQHVAIIMDGNGRWAANQHKPRILGHRQGAKAVRRVIEVADKANIQALTLFAFSCENWRRPDDEVSALLELFSQQLYQHAQQLNANNIRVRIMGNTTILNDTLQKEIAYIQRLTEDNTGMQLVIALNYSGRWDIVQATRQLAQKAKANQLHPENISEQDLNQHLCLQGIREPDLLIRTSGEMRISNFMLWQLAYTEFYFTSILWPDFNEAAFYEALEAYAERERRYGKVASAATSDQALTKEYA